MLENLIVEEKTLNESKFQKFIDDRANLEEAYSNMNQTAQIAAEEHRTQMEIMKSKLSSLEGLTDIISVERKQRSDLAKKYEKLKVEYRATKERHNNTLKLLTSEIEKLKTSTS